MNSKEQEVIPPGNESLMQEDQQDASSSRSIQKMEANLALFERLTKPTGADSSSKQIKLPSLQQIGKSYAQHASPKQDNTLVSPGKRHERIGHVKTLAHPM